MMTRESGLGDLGTVLLQLRFSRLAVMIESRFEEMKTMKNAIPILPAILALILSGYSSADELTDAVEGLCDTIRTCALEAVAGPDLTDELRQKMAPVLENNCAQIRSRVKMVAPGHKLYQPAVGCLRSMESLSCSQLQNAGEVKTPECTEYDRLANEANAVTP
jgi:hypothetical protein